MDEEMYDDLNMSEISEDFGIPEEPNIWMIHTEITLDQEEHGQDTDD